MPRGLGALVSHSTDSCLDIMTWSGVKSITFTRVTKTQALNSEILASTTILLCSLGQSLNLVLQCQSGCVDFDLDPKTRFDM